MEKLKLHQLNRLTPDEFRRQPKLPLVLVLDNVRSGLNVGSIFRTADAFRLEKIVLCGITAQPPHREILKTALGSCESVTWEYAPEALSAVQALQADGYAVWAVEQTTDKVLLDQFNVGPTQKYALVLGNEVEGVGNAVLAACTGSIEIPQYGTKHSLNVAVAAGIVVWEMVRQFTDPDRRAG